MSNDSCSNDYEIICNVVEEATTFEIIDACASIPHEPETPPQPIDRHDTIDNGHESAELPPPTVPEVIVEHVQEVSFPTHTAKKSSTQAKSKKLAKGNFLTTFPFFISVTPGRRKMRLW